MMRARPWPRPYPQRNEALCAISLVALLALTFTTGADASPLPGGQAFLDWFWQRPLLAQGRPYTLEGGNGHPLAPETCGQCHREQFDDWQRSRHAKAMGPGVLGQFPDMSPEQIQECLNCHAPLREQADSLQRALTELSGPGPAEGPSHSADSLHGHGVLCGACHVRNYRWYGPPRRENLPAPDPKSVLPHEGWSPETAFEDPRFCAACHQFPEGGYALNGKLIENTYEEWKTSPQAARGLTCQSCHMPDRRHLWRGIHDPETVLSGVSIVVGPISVADSMLRGRLSLTNSNTGHFFPTYVTPEVVLEAYQESTDGNAVEGSGQRLVIARQVSLDLSIEHSDTRLAPGQTATLDYARPLSPEAVRLVMKIRVAPDAFYSRFFQALLESELDQKSRELITQALDEANASAFSLFQERSEIPALLAPGRDVRSWYTGSVRTI